MYTAEIVNKEIKSGKLIVAVQFSNGTETFTENFETTQGQQGGWIGSHIIRRLNDLNSLITLHDSLSLGAFEGNYSEPERELYRERLRKYFSYLELARQGIIRSDREVLVTLRAWLKSNFKDEYVDVM